MPKLDWLPLISYCLIAIFTPGPNNISSTSMGVLVGYKRTLRFILGITLGFFIVLLADALIANALLAVLPGFESILRIVGALYIALLAFETLRKSFQMEVNDKDPHGFWHGLILQVVNVKGILFGLTVYAAFLAPLQGSLLWLILSALVLAGLAFIATSTWALFGSAIRRYLNNPRVQRIVSVALALLLLYTALSISGLIDWLKVMFAR